MKLDNLRKSLYSKESEMEDRPSGIDLLDPRAGQSPKASKSKSENTDTTQKGKEVTIRQRGLFIKALIAIGALLLLLAASYAFFSYQNSKFSPDKVLLSFDLPQATEVGQNFSFRLLFHNNNRVDLDNCQLTLSFPKVLKINEVDKTPTESEADVLIFDLTQLQKNENGILNLEGVINEQASSTVYLEASLSYVKKGGREKYTKQTREGMAVNASKIDISLEADRQASSGDIVNFLLKIKNNTGNNLNNLEARFSYPQGFSLTNTGAAIPLGAEKNIFEMPTLTAHGQTDVNIQGVLSGSSAEKKTVKAQVGLLDPGDEKFTLLKESEASIEMISSPLKISQKISGAQEDQSPAIDPGRSFGVEIEYFNSSDVPLRDAIILADVQGEVVDYLHVSSENGFFDPSKKQMVWRGSDVESLKILEPQEKGVVRLEIPTLAHLPSNNLDDKNFEISVLSQIDSPDVPTPTGQNKLISTDKKSVKLNSKALFEDYGYYNDNAILNNGPLPPVVGEETTYSIHWEVININNDLEGVVVTSSLPPYVSWKNNFYPTNSQEITYNERTGEIVWKLGKVSALTGTQLAKREIVFQIGLTPQENQKGQAPILINETSFGGKDLFTAKDYRASKAPITTNLGDDISIGSNEANVVE